LVTEISRQSETHLSAVWLRLSETHFNNKGISTVVSQISIDWKHLQALLYSLLLLDEYVFAVTSQLHVADPGSIHIICETKKTVNKRLRDT
jgi:hypothetical protein